MMKLFVFIFILAVLGRSHGMGYGASYSGDQSQAYSASSYSSQSVQVNYQQEWPNLYDVPVFRQFCDLGSGVKSNSITQRIIGGRNDFDYYQTFSELYRRNQDFQNYIFATTGIRATREEDLRRFFSIVGQQPGGLLRSVSLFARHPRIFKSRLVNIALQRKSRELLEWGAQNQLFDTYQDSFSQILRSRYYRRKFSHVLGCNENSVFGALQQAYQRNTAGTLLLLKHIITRRQLYSLNDYYSVNANTYASQSSIFRRKAWAHHHYYTTWHRTVQTTTTTTRSSGGGGLFGGAGGILGGVGGIVSDFAGARGGGLGGGVGRRASVQQTTQVQEQVQEHESANQVGIEGSDGYGAGGLAASGSQKSVTKTYTKTTTTTINYQEHWPNLYQEPFFQDICNLQSNYRSRQINERFLGRQQYDYESIFSNLYRRNDIFQQYLRAATGVEEFNSQFYGLVKENPGSLLRMVSLFAKHPVIFKHNVARDIFGRTSLELVQYGLKTPCGDDYFDALTTSQTYRKLFSAVFSCGTDPKTIRYRLLRAYRKNPNGTILLVKHVLTRRQLYSESDYMGLNVGLYNSQRHMWGRKQYRHNSYFSKYVMRRSSTRSGFAKLDAKRGGKIRGMMRRLNSDSSSSDKPGRHRRRHKK